MLKTDNKNEMLDAPLNGKLNMRQTQNLRSPWMDGKMKRNGAKRTREPELFLFFGMAINNNEK
jgi:hypothetical protein